MVFAALTVIASYLALLCALIILLKKNKHISDYYLTAWLFVLFMFIFFKLDFSHLFTTLGKSLAAFHGIFIFLYVKNITFNSRFQPKDLLHFMLPVIMLLPMFYIDDYVLTQLYQIFKILIYTLYIALAALMVRKYRRKIKENYSNIELADISWLIILICGNLFFAVNATIEVLFSGYPAEFVEEAALFVFMNITGIKGMLQAAVFIKQPVEEGNVTERKIVYTDNYGLKGPEVEKLSERLREYVEREKPYVNPTLSLKDLAMAMDTYPHYITLILNTVFNQNFYDFINHYRVVEAEHQLIDPSKAKLTIVAIAYDCGFNSKATFNRVFKEKKGVTPTEYKLIAQQ